MLGSWSGHQKKIYAQHLKVFTKWSTWKPVANIG